MSLNDLPPLFKDLTDAETAAINGGNLDTDNSRLHLLLRLTRPLRGGSRHHLRSSMRSSFIRQLMRSGRISSR